jgi:Asp-tRNA(Asn)/Glu-tRNA(Gln) amidotransferase B subunit
MNPQQIETLCLDVLSRFPGHADRYRQGHSVLGFLVGQALRETAGRVTPQQASDTFVRLLAT